MTVLTPVYTDAELDDIEKEVPLWHRTYLPR